MEHYYSKEAELLSEMSLNIYAKLVQRLVRSKEIENSN